MNIARRAPAYIVGDDEGNACTLESPKRHIVRFATREEADAYAVGMALTGDDPLKVFAVTWLKPCGCGRCTFVETWIDKTEA